MGFAGIYRKWLHPDGREVFTCHAYRECGRAPGTAALPQASRKKRMVGDP
jgi:hypothetical protein